MGSSKRCFIGLLLYISVVNVVHLPLVKCQDEESTQCVPKEVFLVLLRLPEVSSNLAAYSRMAGVTEGARSCDDTAHLKALTEDSEGDAEICLPGRVYLELFKDPGLRGHLSAIGRTQKPPDLPGRLLDDNEEINTRELQSKSQKRSISVLAKNDDLPISIQDRLDENQEDQDKRTFVSNEETGPIGAAVPLDSLVTNGNEGSDPDAFLSDSPAEKRNVGALARDFALPPARLTGKRNVASLARTFALPPNGKRNVASIARTFALPPNGKRNVASIARDYGLPYANKKSIASLRKNMAWPTFTKRAVKTPGYVLLSILSRRLANSSFKKPIDSNDMRFKRRHGFTDQYPFSVIQDTNAFDYGETMDPLTGQYSNAEKRFMGRIPQMGPRPTTPSTRRQGR
ncbi:neuropeptide-like 1 isoform X2 [Hylaeus anthracinus]|uniref:neuropeptide-like 1 isoform X2 n=1 Tax=Hylaeus anthracinus TaxID=313031 RepID=UPI0023B8E388|nr:neuropeptide-like 1 isoform X2 [Hylaeus anthracinus]